MGKNKIKIEKIETTKGRKETYKNRIGGLVKKAKELSILCDVPVLLVTASPNDEFTLTVGQNSNFEDIIQKYADQTPAAREKSQLPDLDKVKSLETLIQMESILLDALKLNDLQKDQFAQQVQIQCSCEVQNMPPQEVLVQPLDKIPSPSPSPSPNPNCGKSLIRC
ncbi:hypothetical protein LUZ61_016640 [Rhynchospora tenuis]|uniref:MADS-box domain-containing protein n=1 Tax=Rhynchospora tenuis TaxID=198213 RepID=A0AAD5Z5Y7_9POAL|nr:hypothetical protein LUZ61_016640 [Rhynchospora tenuis]